LEREMLEMTAPTAYRRWPQSEKVVMASAELARRNEFSQMAFPQTFGSTSNRQQSRMSPQNTLDLPVGSSGSGMIGGQMNDSGDERVEWVFQNGKWVPIRVSPPRTSPGTMQQPLTMRQQPVTEQNVGGNVEWTFQDGKWVPVQSAPPALTREPMSRFGQRRLYAPPQEQLPADMGWGTGVQARLIKIPADKLLAGDPRYNIVIKPGDSIHVPVDVIGEFCIMGNVNRQGYVNLTGRPMTLKMAIASAGGLGPLAWPKRCEVVRRIGEKREEIVMVDLDKIASGEQPDFFIKPNDMINVGTDATSRWRAVLRNSFRSTYGFGFVYDRNFARHDYFGLNWL